MFVNFVSFLCPNFYRIRFLIDFLNIFLYFLYFLSFFLFVRFLQALSLGVSRKSRPKSVIRKNVQLFVGQIRIFFMHAKKCYPQKYGAA